MPVIEITSLEHPGVDVFGTLTEAQLRNRIDPEKKRGYLHISLKYIALC